MIDAVFISDLHLHPQETAIKARFDQFIAWAKHHTRAVYILGDFLHAWPGDDALDEWSNGIALQLASLASHGVKLYFMHGNRDFLIGSRFTNLARMSLLKEPTIIRLGDTQLLLVHGDRYCTNDRTHQWLMRITRNALFTRLFLCIPYKTRAKLVSKVREHSQENRKKSARYMDIVPASLLQHMQAMGTQVLIHGHIHKPGLTTHEEQSKLYRQYVLSDWDDNPSILCYDETKGFYFERM